MIEQRLVAKHSVFDVFVDPKDGEGQAWLHDRGEVLKREAYPDGRMHYVVRLSGDRAGQAIARFGRALRPAEKLKQAAE
jgi:GTP-binding protein HflX